jgi:uncharacterized membrane protein YdbT with pleckstrin-like domain
VKQGQETVQLVIRPSMKLVRAGYTAVFVLLFLAVLAYTNSPDMQKLTAWVLAIPALLLLWPMKYHLRSRYTHMTLAGDKLRYETGILSRSKRVIQLTKVQDVRVDQTVTQRLLRTGDISLETAGETSLLTIRNVDSPDAVTSQILRVAHPEIGERRVGHGGS